MRVLDCLEPRRYQATDDEFIQDQFQEVFEVVFVCRGRIIVGYRLFKEVFYAKIVSKSASIGDFSCLNNKVSEFLYKASETVTGFAIKKEKFTMIMRQSLAKQLISKIKHNYINKIREPVVSHREIEARKFQTRIDYVDLSAFGVGVKFSDIDHNKTQLRQIQQTVERFCSKYGRLLQTLEDLDQGVDLVMHHVCAMAIRYDERMNMILQEARYDSYQRDFIARAYKDEDYA